MVSSVWDAGAMRPAGVLRRAAALALDAVLLGWFVAWLLLPLPGLSPWAVLALTGLYTVLAEGARGRTLGKKAAGLYVLEASGGGPIGYRRATLRWALRAAPAVPALLALTLAPGVPAVAVTALALAASLADHLWALRHPLARTLHDVAAGTVVLRIPRPTLLELDEGHPWHSERGRRGG